MQAMHNTRCYQKQMVRAYLKKVRPRSFQPGDLVLQVVHLPDGRGKFRPNWHGPFVVKQAFSDGAAILEDMDQTGQSEPINACYLKKYYQ